MTTQQGARNQKAENTEVKRRMADPQKPELPPIKTFLVRRVNTLRESRVAYTFRDALDSEHSVTSVPLFIEEGIEAHRYDEHLNGSISFYRYLDVSISDQGVLYSYRLERLLAAGSYYDIREVTSEFQTQPAN